LQRIGYGRIAGVDEAGRGPLAGPVVAAAVVLPSEFHCPNLALLNDSKQMSHVSREILFGELAERVEYGVGIVDAGVIDAINIRQASWRAMQVAVADLLSKPDLHQQPVTVDYVLIDGLGYGAGPWPYEAIVKGDARCLSIAAASVIAKVTRDRIMEHHAREFPDYGFEKHKGYPSRQHLNALQRHGACPLHRRSYAPVRQVLEASVRPEQVLASP
jgi:ribonuclease HII